VSNPTLTKSYDAGAVIVKRRIVKPGSADFAVIHAAASTDDLIGVADLGAAAIGDRVDVHHAGIATVELGGTVARGGFVTSDANGKGIAAAPAAGVNAAVIGRALISGVDGDLIPVLIAPGRIQG